MKVVQRVPVRIAFETKPDQPVLRSGMSVVATVDTGYKRSISGLTASIGHALGL